LVGYVQFTAVFSIPLRAQIVDLDSPVKSGLRLLPLVSATAFGSLFGGGTEAQKGLTAKRMEQESRNMEQGSRLIKHHKITK
jgi:hypothetical protein